MNVKALELKEKERLEKRTVLQERILMKAAQADHAREEARERVLEEKQEARKIAAAVRIQARFRGVLGRRKAMQRTLEKEFVRVEAAARTIQSHWRGMKGRQKAKKEREKYETYQKLATEVMLERLQVWIATRAVSTITRFFRARKKEKAAMTIQRVYRGHLGRQVAAEAQRQRQMILTAKHATSIQRMYRGFLARRHVRKAKADRQRELEQSSGIVLYPKRTTDGSVCIVKSPPSRSAHTSTAPLPPAILFPPPFKAKSAATKSAAAPNTTHPSRPSSASTVTSHQPTTARRISVSSDVPVYKPFRPSSSVFAVEGPDSGLQSAPTMDIKLPVRASLRPSGPSVDARSEAPSSRQSSVAKSVSMLKDVPPPVLYINGQRRIPKPFVPSNRTKN
mmetsp:Transcript_2252/g.3413  ORF Transcript_2252/g.3413 Transcript_2252/m.3413 type:complete len:394 (+) Transcript_2252:984-2165(+)